MPLLTPMPKYRCHKEVWALKIESVAMIEDGTAVIIPQDEHYEKFSVDAAYVKRHIAGVSPDIVLGGYFVQYADGYQSFSPAKAFEDGYTLIRE